MGLSYNKITANLKQKICEVLEKILADIANDSNVDCS